MSEQQMPSGPDGRTPDPGSGPEPEPEPERVPRGFAAEERRVPTKVWIGFAAVIVIGVVLAAASGGFTPPRPNVALPVAGAPDPIGFTPAGTAAQGPVVTDLSATGVSVVEFDGLTGQVDISAGGGTTVSDRGSGHTLLYQLDPATHVLHLSCAPSGSCPSALYVVNIPAHIGVTLHQVSGQTALTDISGPVAITASSANTTAVGLTVPSFTADITSGQLDASFSAVPSTVRVTVVSANATIHLPSSGRYAVTRDVVSGDADVAVPQDPSSPDTVDLTVNSGQIGLVGD
jgi:hypothetical protein